MPRDADPLFELAHHLSKRKSRGFEQHDQMIEEIGCLELEMLAVALDRGKRCLDRFLADFLGAFLDALRKELGGIGDLGRRALAGGHRVGEFGQSLEPVA